MCVHWLELFIFPFHFTACPWLIIWLIGFSGVDGTEGHAGVSEHLWGALFPQQSGHETLGLYTKPPEQAWTWVMISWSDVTHTSVCISVMSENVGFIFDFLERKLLSKVTMLNSFLPLLDDAGMKDNKLNVHKCKRWLKWILSLWNMAECFSHNLIFYLNNWP